MKKAIYFILSLALLAAAGYAALTLWSQHTSVAVARAVRGPAVQAVYATGTVEATVMMPVASRAAARLMALNVDEGSEVTKGQVLAQLEDGDLQHTIQQLEAQEAFAKKDFDRNVALVKRDVSSRHAYDLARANWLAAQAATSAAKSQAGYLKLVAPADGLIIKRDGEIGQLIPANTPVFWLSCCAPLRISTEVDEEDIAKVRPGQEVLIRADAFPGKIFNGKVQAITPKGDPVARSYRVRVEFAGENPLQIGMTAETNIIVGRRTNALLVPSSALVQDYVWLVRAGHLARQPVTVGTKGPEQIEIRTGITDADLVVVKPDATMQAGEAVRPVMAVSPASNAAP